MTSTSELTPEGQSHPVTSSSSVDDANGALETRKDIHNLNDVIMAEDLRRTLAIRSERDAGVIDNSERTAEAGEMIMGAIHLGDSHVHHYRTGDAQIGAGGQEGAPVIPREPVDQQRPGKKSGIKQAAITAALVAGSAAGGAGTIAVLDAMSTPEPAEVAAPEYPGTVFGISSDDGKP